MREASLILVALISMGVLHKLVKSSIDTERITIFTGKVMPAKYVKHNVTVENACQCRNLCEVVLDCTSTTWIRMADTNTSRCLISASNFSVVELQDPDQGISSAKTFYWFNLDFTPRQYGFYKVRELHSGFYDALNFCRSQGGELVTLETNAKMKDVTSFLWQGSGAQYWIGLYQEVSTANPVWMNVNGNTSMTEVTVSGGGSANCYSTLNGPPWTVQNRDCNTQLYAVCERNF
ncbi:uncharacterized protein [Macrobrachium rosenbergii]|uniref:uncharacterized protein n=1 Tax=Macrobrachium rosenbergii TaxID=79674 RepID=UPI0034D6E90F